MMTIEESKAWHPELDGWSDDILPFYRRMAEEMPNGSSMAEIGCFHTRSLRFLASECVRLNKLDVKIYAVDPSPTQVSLWAPVSPDLRVDDWGVLLRNLQAAPAEERALIYTLRAPSVRAARMFDDGELYLAFIDAAHDEKSVLQDGKAWKPKVCKGGVLAGHDYGAEAWHSVHVAVDAMIPKSELQVDFSVWSWRVR